MGGKGFPMKENVLRSNVKTRRLMQLYSVWQETRREEIQQKCLALLGDVIATDPNFNLRQEFQKAF